MYWFRIHTFKENLEKIEQFFVQIAANEEQLLTFGFERTMTFPGAEGALEALKTFDEDFAMLKRYMFRMNRAIGNDLERLDPEGNLTEQVSLIALRLRIAKARDPISASLSVVNKLFFYMPYFSKLRKSKKLFGEEPISLHKTIINLGKLRGLTNTCWELVSNQENSNDAVFKPSNVIPDHVLDLIDSALADVKQLSSISPSERTRIEWYLQEAKKELLLPSHSWPKIVGALVIVAAITSGIADAPNAAKNVKDAIEYILGTSVEKPLQKYLSEPTGDRCEQAELAGISPHDDGQRHD